MQTFLPYADFTETARVLDRRRLGKQRVETIQVLRALTVPGYGWRRHPAALMWTGYAEALVRYGLEMCDRWCALGHADTCAGTLVADLAAAGELPPWLGDPDFHLSHRSALVRKDPAFYGPVFPGVPDDLPYLWPSSDRTSHEAGAGG